MANEDSRQVRSPLLPMEEVWDMLIGWNADLGAAGGRLGGAIGGTVGGGVLAGLTGAAGGASGGRAGARFGARHLTSIRGAYRRIQAPLNAQSGAVLTELLGPPVQESNPPASNHPASNRPVHIGRIFSGFASMNGVVVQVCWLSDTELEATAHALEGIISQRTAEKALDKLSAALQVSN